MSRGHPDVVFGALVAVLVFAVLFAGALLANWPLTLPYQRLRDVDLIAGLVCAAGAAFLAFRRGRAKLE